MSAELREVLEPLLQEVESLNARIQEYDERMEKIAQDVYPEVSLLKQVKGVGTQIALTYVLTIEDPLRITQTARATMVLRTPSAYLAGILDSANLTGKIH